MVLVSVEDELVIIKLVLDWYRVQLSGHEGVIMLKLDLLGIGTVVTMRVSSATDSFDKR